MSRAAAGLREIVSRDRRGHAAGRDPHEAADSVGRAVRLTTKTARSPARTVIVARLASRSGAPEPAQYIVPAIFGGGYVEAALAGGGRTERRAEAA
jgi:hypothetical protein